MRLKEKRFNECPKVKLLENDILGLEPVPLTLSLVLLLSRRLIYLFYDYDHKINSKTHL